MGGKKATTTSKVSIPPEVLARYNAVNARAEKAASTPYEAFGSSPSDFVAQLNARQYSGFDDINAKAGSYEPYLDAAGNATTAGMGPAYEGIDRYMSPYIKNVADTTGAMLKQQYEQAQSGALGTAASSGAFGGDRAGIAAANMQQQNQMGYGSTMANIYNQGYTQALGASQADLARQLQGGAQMAELGAESQRLGLQGAQAKIAAGTMEQQTEQAGKDAMIEEFMRKKGYDFQTAQYLANIAMGTGAASGTTTSTTTPRNWLGFASGGGVSGYADGGGVAGPRTFSQGQIGGQGYVPAGDLPVGQLMVADPPQQQQDDKTGEIIQLIASTMGMNRGGVAGGRHGYALDGAVEPSFLERLNKLIGPEGSVSNAIAGDPRTQEGLQRREAGRNAISTVLGVAGPVMGFGPQVMQMPSSPWANGGPYAVGSTSPAQPAATGVVTPATPATPPPAATGVVTPTPPATPTPAATGVVAPATPPPAGADVASDAMVAVGQPNPATLGSPTQTSSLIDQKAPTLEPKPSNWNMADTGLAPTGGYGAIVPIKKQLDFVTYELQKPEYKGYLENTYATPAQAAVAFEQVYERANGSGNDIAAANATDIYNAAQSGKLDQLPPNVVTAYNHFVQNGMDPIQAAGAAGRLMVESYSHLDPNARNTLGGGNGTYGLAQWRGPRMEELANFAGVPLEAITNAPVSTPEGRYYSHGSDFSGGLGGGNQGSGGGDQIPTDGLAGADVTQRRGDPLNINKPYEDRNLIGKFFHDPTTGKLNPIAIKALLSGISGAAQAKTISPLGGILAGIGAGNDTYNTLQNEEPKRVAEIMANSKNARIQYLTEVAMGEERPFEQWAVSKYGSGPASMFGSPEGGTPANLNMGRADILGIGLSQNITLPNGVVVQGGQNYAYLTKLANDLQPFVAAGSPQAIQTAATVDARLNDIRNSQGVVQDINGNDVKDPTYTSTLDTQTRTQFGREKTLEFEGKAIEGQQRADRELSMIKHQVEVFTKFPAGALATDKAAGLAILQSLGVPVPADTSEYAAAAQEALKGAARKLLDSVGTDAPAAEMAQLQQAIESPNMEPAAVKTILSMQKAQAEREKQYYKLRPEWNAANPSMAMDQSAYEDWFTTEHPFEKYYQEAKAGMPIFAGELGSRQKPHPAGTAYSDIGLGQYFTLPDGRIGQREE